ncbi:SulP family inorganic anion transporter, partial [Streptomyces rhizosphaericola]|uniref:SulP family inorganic anion transporter n=1 Tax=Streptomyces rhizosphaericola TaxID=2564098 RepID=UPI003BF4D344
MISVKELKNPHVVRRDLLASLVVFLVALPLCVGVAVASGVPAELGLVTGIVGGIVVGGRAATTARGPPPRRRAPPGRGGGGYPAGARRRGGPRG